MSRVEKIKVKRRRVLVVEDERDIAKLLELHLRDANFEVSLAADGHEGMRMALEGQWDLVILDIRLPGPDGLTICRTLRREMAYVPILLLTSKTTELDRVLGLELGADDYVSKPFSVTELIARVKAIFRRIESVEMRFPGSAEYMSIGEITIDTKGRTVSNGDSDVALTAREFDLLLHLARHPGQVFSRAQLLDSVWGYGHEGYEHTVNSHINRLRAKIEKDAAHPQLIVTVWGVGYKLDGTPTPVSTTPGPDFAGHAGSKSNVTHLRR
jgi:DNA-binding response OmpR family regulator